MRCALACLFVAVLGGNAIADAKISQLIKSFEREAGTCKKNARGITVVIERGQPVSGKDQELAEHLAELVKLQATIQGHCDEIAATLELLRADSSATYKQIQKELGEHEQKLRTARAASRQALVDAQPMISWSVPRMNKLIAEADAAARPSTRELKAAADKAAAEEKAAAEKAAAEKAAAEQAAAKKVEKTAVKPVEVKPLSKFPSGRGIELPAPAEAWTLSGTSDTDIAEYAFAGAKATLFARRHAGAPTCDQIRVSMNLVSGRTPMQSAEAGAELKPFKPTWVMTWSEGDRQVRAMCVAGKGAVVVVRVEASLAGNAPLETVLARMIAANLKR